MKNLFLSTLFQGMSYDRKEIVELAKTEFNDMLLPYGRQCNVRYLDLSSIQGESTEEDREKWVNHFNHLTPNRPYYLVLVDERYLYETSDKEALAKMQDIYNEEIYLDLDLKDLISTKEFEFEVLKEAGHIERAIYIFREIEGNVPIGFDEDKEARAVLLKFKEKIKSEIPDQVIEYKASFDEFGIADKEKLQVLRTILLEKLKDFVDNELELFGEINDSLEEMWYYEVSVKNKNSLKILEQGLEEHKMNMPFLEIKGVSELVWKEELAGLLHIMGIISARQFGRKAEQYLKEALKLRQEIVEKVGSADSREKLAQIYNTLGIYYANVKFIPKLEKAKEFLEKSLFIRKQLHQELNNVITKENLAISNKKFGDICAKTNDREDYDIADYYYEKSLELFNELLKERDYVKYKVEKVRTLLNKEKNYLIKEDAPKKGLYERDSVKILDGNVYGLEEPVISTGVEFSAIAYIDCYAMFLKQLRY